MTPPNIDTDRHGAIGRFSHVVIGAKKIAAPGAKKRGRKAKMA